MTAVTTVLSILTVAYLINDINTFYEEALEQIAEFKVRSLNVCDILTIITSFDYSGPCQHRME